MKRILLMMYVTAILTGCAGGLSRLNEAKISSPKVIALDAPNASWVTPITTELKKSGFRILRTASRSSIIEKTSRNRLEQFNKAEARYVLVISGYVRARCFAGGYNFGDINVDLVDTESNETILSFNDTGLSENCFPLSGHIFSDIANAVSSAWK